MVGAGDLHVSFARKSLLWACFGAGVGSALTGQAAWSVRWQSVCGSRCGQGNRALEVTCRQGGAPVDGRHCDASTRPNSTQPCTVACTFVDPLQGDDNNLGNDDSPLRTVTACVDRAGTSRDDLAAVTRCVLAAGRYTEPPIDLSGRHRLVIEPAASAAIEDAAVFDGTDVVPLQWTERGATMTADVGSFVQRVEALVVDDAALQQASDYSTASQPCFLYRAGAGDDAVPRPFACEDAARKFTAPAAENATGARAMHSERALPSFWFDRSTALLHVAAAGDDNEFGIAPEVRVKNESRREAFVMGGGNGSEHVYLHGLHFFGTTAALAAPKSDEEQHDDIRIEQCRFIYHPAAVHVSTTGREAHGAGRRVELIGNTLEFGEGALSYRASAATVSGNLLVGNSLAARGAYSVDGRSEHDVLEDNTFLYNGDLGGHSGWGPGNTARRNLWLGQSFLSRSHGAAVHKISNAARAGFMCEGNWFLGPSLAASIRFEDGADEGGAEQRAVIRNNVFLGHEPLLVAGGSGGPVFMHNTGDYMQVLAPRRDTASAAAGAQALMGHDAGLGPADAAPSLAVMNACGDLSMCNSATSPLSSTAGGLQLHSRRSDEAQGDVCSLLVGCHPGSQGTNVYSQLRAHLPALRPHLVVPLSHAQARALDFRPASGAENAPLRLGCGEAGGCHGGNSTAASSTGAQAGFLGAYTLERSLAPGCWASGCRRQAFQMPQLAAQAVTTTSTLHPLGPGPGEIATKVLQCDTLRTYTTCNGPEFRVLGMIVESSALCRGLCETSGKQNSLCCVLKRDEFNHFSCYEYQVPFSLDNVLSNDGYYMYAATCRWIIAGRIPEDQYDPTPLSQGQGQASSGSGVGVAGFDPTPQRASQNKQREKPEREAELPSPAKAPAKQVEAPAPAKDLDSPAPAKKAGKKAPAPAKKVEKKVPAKKVEKKVWPPGERRARAQRVQERRDARREVRRQIIEKRRQEAAAGTAVNRHSRRRAKAKFLAPADGEA